MSARTQPTRQSRLFLVSVAVFSAALCAALGTALYVLKKRGDIAKPATSRIVESEEDAPSTAGSRSAQLRPATPRLGFPPPGAPSGPGVPGIPAPNMQSAADTAAEVLGELRKSGAPVGTWTRAVEQMFTKWKASSPVGSQVEFSGAECFRKGCSVTALCPDMQSFGAVTHDLRSSQVLEALNSPGFRSGPIELPSGQIKFYWVVYHEDR